MLTWHEILELELLMYVLIANNRERIEGETNARQARECKHSAGVNRISFGKSSFASPQSP
jgi:hypothetical protein